MARGRGRTALERRVLEAVDMAALVAYLRELVAIPSVGGRERPAQESVAGMMRRIGLDVDTWELDLGALRVHPDASMEVEREEGLGVVGTFGPGTGGRSLILNGHVDVVPAGEGSAWTSSPWKAEVRRGRVYGRGTADMKGGLACGLFAAKALVDAGAVLDGRLLVESVIGEEDGGIGTLAAAVRGYHADGAVIMEPTELHVAPAQAGALSFRITVSGLAAHACVREEGVSAIDKFLPIREALVALEHHRNRGRRSSLFARYDLPYALNIGTLRAGTWPSSVPESLVLEGRYGIAVGENPTKARQEFRKVVAAAARRDPWLRKHPPRVEWWGGQFESASVPVDHPLPQTVAAALRDVRRKPAAFEGMPYGSDMRLLVKVAETPTILFGPGDVRRSHRPDEWVSLADLKACVQTLALAAVRFCRGRA